jgi:hypothetical protein
VPFCEGLRFSVVNYVYHITLSCRSEGQGSIGGNCTAHASLCRGASSPGAHGYYSRGCRGGRPGSDRSGARRVGTSGRGGLEGAAQVRHLTDPALPVHLFLFMLSTLC